VPLTSNKLFHLLEVAGFPPGVVQLVNGSKETVNSILDHPAIRAISFVGSTATARHIYSRAAANGKRAQCQGGAKNPVVVMPDADMEMTTKILADSAFGCAASVAWQPQSPLLWARRKMCWPSSWPELPAAARWVMDWIRAWRWAGDLGRE